MKTILLVIGRCKACGRNVEGEVKQGPLMVGACPACGARPFYMKVTGSPKPEKKAKGRGRLW